MTDSSCQFLANHNVILGISGGIAAYKAAILARRLIDAGATVQVVMTPNARQFISPLTLQALTGRPVRIEQFDVQAEAAMSHIELARWADLIVIAPATANTIARLANGYADELLSTVSLASSAPKFIAPAMNQQMWRAKATQRNIQTLRQSGVHIIGPAEGDQACGDIGPGRMVEPADIMSVLQQWRSETTFLAGQRIVITAGPTYEPLDPVRFLGNRSTGTMGFALADVCASMGAQVTLVAGPVAQPTPAGVCRIDVTTALEMHDAVLDAISEATDGFIGCAAVADYRPAQKQVEKIKKTGSELVLTFIRNPDIIKAVSMSQNRPRWVVGFAAETCNLETYAKRKLHEKRLDAVCANDVSRSDLGFGRGQNALTVYTADGKRIELPASEKPLLARRLMCWLKTHVIDRKRDA